MLQNAIKKIGARNAQDQEEKIQIEREKNEGQNVTAYRSSTWTIGRDKAYAQIEHAIKTRITVNPPVNKTIKTNRNEMI